MKVEYKKGRIKPPAAKTSFVEFEKSDLLFNTVKEPSAAEQIKINNLTTIQIRGDGSFKGLGFWLSDRYNWSIIKDEENEMVLVPTLKKSEE